MEKRKCVHIYFTNSSGRLCILVSGRSSLKLTKYWPIWIYISKSLLSRSKTTTMTNNAESDSSMGDRATLKTNNDLSLKVSASVTKYKWTEANQSQSGINIKKINWLFPATIRHVSQLKFTNIFSHIPPRRVSNFMRTKMPPIY